MHHGAPGNIAGYETAPMNFSVRKPGGLTKEYSDSPKCKPDLNPTDLKMKDLSHISGHIFPFGSVMKPVSLLNPQENLYSGSATSN